MSTVLHPVGPRPPQVYWVRRLVVLAVVVVVLAAVVVAWTVLGRGAASADGAPADGGAGTDAAQGADGGAEDVAASDTSEDAAEDAAQEAPATPVACAPADLTVALTADGATFPAGVQPTFTVSLTNSGAVACTVDSDPTLRELVVTSGSDRIWSSLDCPPEPAPTLLLLEPGARSDAAVPWPRVRSAAGCPADLPEPRPGTYSAVVSALGATSAALVFDLG